MCNVRRAILGGNRFKTKGIYVRLGEPSELLFKGEDDESDKDVDIIDWNELPFVQLFCAVSEDGSEDPVKELSPTEAVPGTAPASTTQNDDEEWPAVQIEGQVPRVPNIPKGSTEAEIRKHNATHIPPRRWCKVCVCASINN